MPVRIEGSDSLMRKLAGLREAVRGEMLERAVVAGALLVQNDAKRRAPFLTGTLRRSIHIGGHDELNSDGESGNVPGPEITPTEIAVYIGTDVAYARRIENGFSGADRLGRTYSQPAQPYLRPALDENQAAVRHEVGEALRDLIRAAI
jgi:HK97 gp10 family phage protein